MISQSKTEERQKNVHHLVDIMHAFIRKLTSDDVLKNNNFNQAKKYCSQSRNHQKSDTIR